MATFEERLMFLFRGMLNAYGTYKIEEDNVDASGKKVGKALTVREPLTLSLWEKHLKGEQSLGVIPINEQNFCFWGCIDVDVYNLEHKVLIDKIEKYGLPLVTCRSKSGGAHIFVFLSEPVLAAIVQAKLREIAAALGYGKSEIFPKQGKVLAEKGDIGNWLNMPYFGGENTTRYAVNLQGHAMTLGQFIVLAENSRMSASELESINVIRKDDVKKGTVDDKDPLFGAPPCLQTLCDQGFPEGTRNNGLFNIAVYARRKWPDDWQRHVEEFNHKYMQPPLNSDEVQLVIKQMGKKEYLYKCNDQPIVSYCNAALCRTRQFGVGLGGSMPVFSSLSKLDTDPPLWFLDVEGARLELSTDELQNQTAFQRECMNRLNIMPPVLKNNLWRDIIQGLLENVMLIEAPNEISTEGQFQELLEDFCSTATAAATIGKESLLLGLPYQEEDKVYFRLKDLMIFLHTRNFKAYTRPQISARIRDLGGGSDFFNIKGKGVGCWWVKEMSQQNESFTVPSNLKAPF